MDFNALGKGLEEFVDSLSSADSIGRARLAVRESAERLLTILSMIHTSFDPEAAALLSRIVESEVGGTPISETDISRLLSLLVKKNVITQNTGSSPLYTFVDNERKEPPLAEQVFPTKDGSAEPRPFILVRPVEEVVRKAFAQAMERGFLSELLRCKGIHDLDWLGELAPDIRLGRIAELTRDPETREGALSAILALTFERPVHVRDARAALRILAREMEKERDPKELTKFLEYMDTLATQSALPDMTDVLRVIFSALCLVANDPDPEGKLPDNSHRFLSLLNSGRFDKGEVYPLIGALLTQSENLGMVWDFVSGLHTMCLNEDLPSAILESLSIPITRMLDGRPELPRWETLTPLILILCDDHLIDDAVLGKAYDETKAMLLHPASEGDLCNAAGLTLFFLSRLPKRWGEGSEVLHCLLESLGTARETETRRKLTRDVCDVLWWPELPSDQVHLGLKGLLSVLISSDDSKVLRGTADLGNDFTISYYPKSLWNRLSLSDLTPAAEHHSTRLSTSTDTETLLDSAYVLSRLSDSPELARHLDVRGAASHLQDLLGPHDDHWEQVLNSLTLLSRFECLTFQDISRAVAYAEEGVRQCTRDLEENTFPRLSRFLAFLDSFSKVKGVPQEWADSLSSYLVEVLALMMDLMEQDVIPTWGIGQYVLGNLLGVTAAYARTRRTARKLIRLLPRVAQFVLTKVEDKNDDLGVTVIRISKIPGIEPKDFDALTPSLVKLVRGTTHYRSGSSLTAGYTMQAMVYLAGGREGGARTLDGIGESILFLMMDAYIRSDWQLQNFETALEMLVMKGGAQILDYPPQLLRATVRAFLRRRLPLTPEEAARLSRILPLLVPHAGVLETAEVSETLRKELVGQEMEGSIHRTVALLANFRQEHPMGWRVANNRTRKGLSGHPPSVARAGALSRGEDLEAAPEEMMRALPLLLLTGKREEAVSLYEMLERLRMTDRYIAHEDVLPPRPVSDELLEREDLMSPPWKSLMFGQLRSSTGSLGPLGSPWAKIAEEMEIARPVMQCVSADSLAKKLNVESLANHAWKCYLADPTGPGHLRAKIWNFTGLKLLVDALPASWEMGPSQESLLPDVLVEASELLRILGTCTSTGHGCPEMASCLQGYITRHQVQVHPKSAGN